MRKVIVVDRTVSASDFVTAIRPLRQAAEAFADATTSRLLTPDAAAPR